MTHDDLPYRDSGFDDTLNEIHSTLTELIAKYGEEHTFSYFKDNPDTGDKVETPVETRRVSWVDEDINFEYRASKFTGQDEIMYGQQVSLTVTENFDNGEKEIYTLQYFPSKDDNGNVRIHLSTKYLQRTSENKKKHDEWWEKNKRPTTNGTKHWAMQPAPFKDAIQYEAELRLDTVKKGVKILSSTEK